MSEISRSFRAAAFLLLAACFVAAQTAAAQSADEIMQRLRLRQKQSHADFQGHLRSGPRRVPFKLEIDGAVVRYIFDKPARTLQLRLGDRSAAMEEITAGNTNQVTSARWDEHLFDTDVTMEDISLQFIYWRDAEILDTNTKVLSRPAWLIRLKSPNKQSQYEYVDLWVDKESGAFIQAYGYDGSNKVIKRFKLLQIQRVADTWFLKEMRIENPVARTQTYLWVEREEA